MSRVEGLFGIISQNEDKSIRELIDICGLDPEEDFQSLSFRSLNLEKVDLSGINFDECDFANANLQGSILRNASFENANLSNADFTGADLKNVNFFDANLLGTKFQFSDIRGASFDQILPDNVDVFKCKIDTSTPGVEKLLARGAILSGTSDGKAPSAPTSSRFFSSFEPQFSWMGMLAKAVMGIVVAKGVGKMITNRAGGGDAGGGLGGMLGGMIGGGQTGSGSQGGAIGGAIGSVMGGGAAPGGVGNFLSGRGNTGAQSGRGLGGLLDSLSGEAAEPPVPQRGGFGGVLNSAFDNFGEPEQPPTPSQEETAKVMLRAMLSAVKAAGPIDTHEKEKILSQLGDISAEETKFVRDELSSPLDIDGLVNDIPHGAEQQAYLMSVMAIDLDSVDEARYLDKLAKALDIDPPTCNAIHDQLGAPKLYT